MVFGASRGHVNQVDGGELNMTLQGPASNFSFISSHLQKSSPRGLNYRENEIIFGQGEPAHTVFFITHGKVKCTATSSNGKVGVVAILKAGEFFGEGCIIGQAYRPINAIAMTTCSITRVEKAIMRGILSEDPSFAEFFISSLIDRNAYYEGALIDHLFNKSETRLARIFLLLADTAEDTEEELVMPRISQEDLAEMVGTTRSRINQFIQKFRRIGLITDNRRTNQIRVRRAVLSTLLCNRPEAYPSCKKLWCDSDVRAEAA
jgi:CRP/FNR family cyclic AMP-dependent transcriptional regulator